jgi:hypothetical protein
MNAKIRFEKWLPWTLAAVVGAVIFQISYGFSALEPSNINWLMAVRHDWGTHYLGWAFYKNEPWHFPLGRVDGYNYPVGTNVGFTDSIPLLAIFFKFFAPLLPSDFQYFGIWLFLCHLLAAYFTIRLFRLFEINWMVTAAASIFVAASPVLLYRGMHPALCGQWMIVASIYFYFLDRRSTSWKKILLFQFLLVSISATINPYLTGMVMGFSIAIPFKHCIYKKFFSWKSLVAYIAVSFLSVLLLWYVTGLIGLGKQEDFGVAGAYGLYGLNLNSLFNPAGYSPLLPQLKQVSWHQYEGFMYLGAGMLFLVALFILYTVCTFVIRKLDKETKLQQGSKDYSHLPLWFLALAYALFSITLVFTYGDTILFRLPAPGFFRTLEEIFRASGRFFWPPYYLIILFTLIGIVKSRFKPVFTTVLIVLALLLQLYDLNRLLTSKNMPRGTYSPPMENSTWINLMREFDEVLFFPAFHPPRIIDMAYQDFSYLAMKAGKPVNLAYVAREDSRARKTFADSLSETVAEGVLSPRALYITDSANLSYFTKAILSYSAVVGSLDKCFYVYAPRKMALPPHLGQLNSKYILHSVLQKNKLTGFAEAARIPAIADKTIRYNIESMNIDKEVISINGWAFIDGGTDNKKDSIFLSLTSDQQYYLAPVRLSDRHDVAEGFGHPGLANSGMSLLAFTDNVKAGIYQLGLVIKDAAGKLVSRDLERPVRIRKPEFVTPVKIDSLPPQGTILFDIIIQEEKTSYTVDGWAALENQDADSSSIHLVLQNGDSSYLLATEPYPRPDVTASFNKRYNLDNSGYTLKVLKSSMPKAKYKVAFLIRDRRHRKETVLFTEKEMQF